MYLDSAFDTTWAAEVLALVLQMSFGVSAFLDSANKPLFHGAVFLALGVCMFKSTMQAAPTACGWTLVQASMSPEPTTILEGITPSRHHAASAMGMPTLCGNLQRITLNQQKRDCVCTHSRPHARTHTHTKERNKSHHSCTAPK